MLLAVDIGNSNIKFGLFDSSTLTSKFSIPTNREASAEDFRHAVAQRLASKIHSVIVCSVVPGVDAPLHDFLRDAVGVEPIFVNNSSDFGLEIDYDPVESLGT